MSFLTATGYREVAAVFTDILQDQHARPNRPFHQQTTATSHKLLGYNGRSHSTAAKNNALDELGAASVSNGSKKPASDFRCHRGSRFVCVKGEVELLGVSFRKRIGSRSTLHDSAQTGPYILSDS
jgi:hypothetical protein